MRNSSGGLQDQVDRFAAHYNDRCQTSLGEGAQATEGRVRGARQSEAVPAHDPGRSGRAGAPGRIDKNGKVTLRHGGHQICVGHAHRGKAVILAGRRPRRQRCPRTACFSATSRWIRGATISLSGREQRRRCPDTSRHDAPHITERADQLLDLRCRDQLISDAWPSLTRKRSEVQIL